jgi:hypothetical protein
MEDIPKARSLRAEITSLFWIWAPKIFNKCSGWLSDTNTFCRRTYNRTFIKNEWVFLKNYPIPISTEGFGFIKDTNVKWRCSVQPAVFVDPFAEIKESRHVPYLALVVIIPGGESPVDLSAWVNDVKCVGNIQPSVCELFLLWCCENSVSYFHCMEDITVEFIDGQGNIIRKGLND